MNALTPDGEPTRVATSAVTLVAGSSFCISSPSGDVSSGGPSGMFVQDVRVLSQWELRVDSELPDALGASTPESYRATFLARVPGRTGATDAGLIVRRDRWIGEGCREDILIRNFGREPAACTITLSVDVDFADLFEVKEGKVRPRGTQRVTVQRDRLVFDHRLRERHRGVIIEAPNSSAVLGPAGDSSGASIRYDVVVPSRGDWSTSILVQVIVDEQPLESSFRLDRPTGESLPARRLDYWRRSTPIATSGHEGLQTALHRSQQDLGALRIFDPDDPSIAAVAAGVPWFMALFGRDSLLSSYMAMPVDRGLAYGTLHMLARLQGRAYDPLSEEQPGRILHEVRLGNSLGGPFGKRGIYYGTADATPLFVVVLGELARWGAPLNEIEPLLPHADRALEWIERDGDRDGDGFVEYQRATDRGLRNQGWKDSWDGVTFADGTVADPPIALCEVQGYVYDAYRSRAMLARVMGDQAASKRWEAKASRLKVEFNKSFWLPERGWYALALDGAKKQVDACASNMGHCLWSGIVDRDKAAQVARHLTSDAMFSGWGVRTLSKEMGAYDPTSYHNGSVWPHDNAIAVAGLMRYGLVAEAQRLGQAVLAAAHAFGGRLPELFCGFGVDEYAEPVPYPTSCAPQAWAAAAPIHIMRALLGFDPAVYRGELRIEPALPEEYSCLQVTGVALGGNRIDLHVDGEKVEVSGLPDGVRLITGRRGLDEPLS
jgi:glycogen debranching enzyme